MHYTFRYSTTLKVYTALCVMALGIKPLAYDCPIQLDDLYIATLFRPLYTPFDRG